MASSFSRPMISTVLRVSLPSSDGFTTSATHSSCTTGYAKPGGITPTTVITVPLTRSGWPSTSGRPWKRSRHSRSLMITTGSAPAWPSASVKSRPSTGRVRSIRNVFGVIHAPR